MRYASQANRSSNSPKQNTSKHPNPGRISRKRPVRSGPSKEALQHLLDISKSARKPTPSEFKNTPPGVLDVPATVVETPSNRDDGASETVEISDEEAAIQATIAKRRVKVLWPGIWTVFALAGTWGTLAYLDARLSPSAETQLPERATIPQSWFLTPTVIKEGVIAGWNELDNLTIGIVVASIGVHLLKRSPLPIWEKLIHITGEKKYTAFTYPFVHGDWSHLAQNSHALIWFLPAVVHYLDGDVFHAAALFVSVPLLTSYLSHFAFRWGLLKGIPLNMGSSGVGAAIIGAFCVAYPDEKVWVPNLFVLRLDAKYCAALFAAMQIFLMTKAPKGGNRPAFIVSVCEYQLSYANITQVHTVSLGLGAAYVYFDGKEHLWRPLIAQLAKANEQLAQP
jgi:membrane associated rhomboid family serine protease